MFTARYKVPRNITARSQKSDVHITLERTVLAQNAPAWCKMASLLTRKRPQRRFSQVSMRLWGDMDFVGVGFASDMNESSTVAGQ